jgi:hypothetical protein
MRRFVTWVCAVLLAAAAGAAFGWLDAGLLRYAGFEYVFDTRYVVACGMKTGILLGTLFGAAAVISNRKVLRIPDLLCVAFVAICSVGAIVILTALMIYAASGCGWYQLPGSLAKQVDYPNRLALCLGVQAGGVAGAAVAAILLVCLTWRSRRGAECGSRSVVSPTS